MTWLSGATVVVPFDFSADSAAALETARAIVGDPARLRVVHVLPLLDVSDPGVIWEAIDDQIRREHAEEALRQELAKLGLGPETPIRVSIGDPGHEIVDYAQQVEAGLIVVSSHGRSALRHLLLGSVAERVVRLATCPVLVLKKPKKSPA